MLPESAGIGPALQPEVPQNAQESPQGDKAARHDITRVGSGLRALINEGIEDGDKQ